MKIEKNIQLPTQYAALTETEKMDTTGGSAAETAAKVVIALGVSGALVCVAGAAAYGILGGTFGFIKNSMSWGKNFINSSMAAGEKLLHDLMGISPLN